MAFAHTVSRQGRKCAPLMFLSMVEAIHTTSPKRSQVTALVELLFEEDVKHARIVPRFAACRRIRSNESSTKRRTGRFSATQRTSPCIAPRAAGIPLKNFHPASLLLCELISVQLIVITIFHFHNVGAESRFAPDACEPSSATVSLSSKSRLLTKSDPKPLVSTRVARPGSKHLAIWLP